MIHTFYYHGEDVPATGLTRPQLSGALHDAAGVLWLDMESEDAAAREMLGIVGIAPNLVELCAAGGAAEFLEAQGGALAVRGPAAPGDVAAGDDMRPITAVLGPNYLVTLHAVPLSSVGRLKERVGRDSAALAEGAHSLLATVIEEIRRDFDAQLDHSTARLAGMHSLASRAPEQVISGDLASLAQSLATLAHGAASMAHLTHRLAWDTELPIPERERGRYRTVTGAFGRLVDRAREGRESVREELALAQAAVAVRTDRQVRRLALVLGLFVPMLFVAGFFGMGLANIPGAERSDAWVLAVVVMALAGLVGVFFVRPTGGR